MRLRLTTIVLCIVASASCGSQRGASSAAFERNEPTAPQKTADASSNELVPARVLAEAIATLDNDHWYGMYIGGRKAGYANIRMRASHPGEPGAFMVALRATIVANGDELRFSRIGYYAGEAPYALVELRSEERSAAGSVERRYAAKRGGLEVHEIVDGVAKPGRQLGETCETLGSTLAELGADPAHLREGQSVVVCSFDLDSEADENTRVTVVQRSTRMIGGVETMVARLASLTEANSVPSESVMAAGAVTLEASFGDGMKIKLEEGSVARSDVAGVDLFSMAIPVSRPLGEPSKIRELAIIVTVSKGFRIPVGPNQQVTARSDGRFDVVIKSVSGAAATLAERTRALAATPAIDRNAAEIVKLAGELTSGVTSEREKVRLLNSWVYQNLRKTLSTNLSTASQVLTNKAGDCTEHAILFVALARAAGIPAREVGGVTYVGDGFAGFGWHAWAEVVLDGRWIQVDPSWNEEVANATHLKLGVGEDDESAATMGALAIEVLAPQPAN